MIPRKLRILRYPDPRLRTRAREVEHVDASIRSLTDRMLDLMYEAKGVGLAATQVGLPLRVFVMDLGDKGVGPEVIVDPVVVERHGEMPCEEGCLSLPELYGPVVRAEEIVIRGRDLEGHEIEVAAAGLRARAVQHELDHLDGVLVIDRMDAEARATVAKRLRELETAFRKKGRK
jgi:peptide deformylase